MKQLKKSLSLLLALLMLVSSMAFTVNAAAYPDIEGSKYEQAINLVSSLGIMTGYGDGTFGPDQALTRAEYCMVLCRLLGMDDVLDSTTYVFFEDVLEEHWAAKAISMIFSLGYASGYGDGNFGPEHSVLYQDAVKMTVNALGYGFMAEQEGGYPNGYIAVASENGLLKNITGDGDQPITRGALAQLVYNALSLELLEEVYSDEGMSYQKGDETLLSRTFNAVKAEGQVTANGATNIAGNNPVNSDEVRIDGVLYKVGNTNAADYLGYNVLFYYTTNDDGEYVLLMCEVKSSANKSLVLEADDIVEHTSQIASGSITYLNAKGDKNVTARLNENPSVVYNGKKVSAVTSTGVTNPDYSLNVLIPANGTVTLVDNNSDGTYDVLDIKEIETYIVNGIDKNRKFIYLKADAEAGKTETVIDLSRADEKEYSFTILKDGEEVDFTALAEWDILSIMKSLDSTSYTIYVSTDMVTGYISKVAQSANGGFGAVTIEGVDYEVVNDYYSDAIEAGLTGTFYLDYTGKVAAYNSASSGSARYVYLMAVDNQSTRLTTDVSIKICTTAGSFATYALNEELYFTGYLNGVWVTDKKVEATDLYSGALTTDGKVNDQLIVIGTDDQNKINEIAMASDINTAGDDYDEDLFSQDLTTRRYGTDATNFNLPRSRDTVGLEAVLPNSSPIFIVTRVDGENSIAENRIAIKYRRDESVFNDSGNLTLSAYDISSGGSIPVAVMYMAQKAAAIPTYRVESGVKLMMVNEVAQGLNEDGDPVTIISGLVNGQATEVTPSSNKLVYAGLGGATFHYRDYLTLRAVADGNFDAASGNDPWGLLSYLMPGDIFYYDTNADGLMEIFQPLIGRLEYATNEDGSVDASKLALYKPTGNVIMPNNPANNSTVAYKGGYDNYAESLEIFGVAYDKDPATNTFKYRCTWNGEDDYILANYCGGFVCIYDVETETFKTGSLADMVTEKQAGEYANKVLVHTEYSYPDWVLIYQ